MGVRGLQTFIERHCEPAYVEVSIPQLVRNYRQETGDQNPIIVVDGSSCLRPMYGDLEWVTGGQMKEYKEKLIFFVNQFKKLGVTLVFFFDGPTENRKRATWVQRRMSTMHDVYKVLDLLASGIKTTDINKRLSLLPAGVNYITQQILQHECECEVHTSIIECDEEIVDFARKNHCFAILGQDSDYVIYEGNHYYLSIIHLDIKTMKTMHYNRDGLARRLHIHVLDLPLLGTLIGNDIISADDLKPFHRDVVKRARGPFAKTTFDVLFPCIAQYVRRLPKGQALIDYLPTLAQYVFRDRSKADLIRMSLESYSSTPFQEPETRNHRLTEWEKILKAAKSFHKRNYFPPMIYAVLIDLPFETSTLIEDYRCKDLKFTASVLRPLRQRIYGILLYEKPPGNGPRVVKEFCMEGPGSLDEEKLVTPVPPRAYHPGLLKLWYGKTEADIALKWNLLISSISLKLKVEKIRGLPEKLALPALIMCYLTEEKILYDWEIDAMLATAVVLDLYNTQRLSELPKDPVSIRAIRISPLYMRSASAVNFLSSACGCPLNPKYNTPCTYFDGKLFQLKYQAAEKKASMLELCDNHVNLMEDFQKVKSVISSVK